MSSGGTLLPWVSITALASLGAVKPTLGSKVPPLETLLPDMEKNLREFSFPMMERDIGKACGIFAQEMPTFSLIRHRRSFKLSDLEIDYQ